MNTDSTYRIENEIKGTIVKNNITFQEVKEFVFNKISANKFDNICLVDYKIIDIATGEYLPLQHVIF